MTNFAQEMAVKTAWGLTLHEWDRASNKQRAYWREHVAQAPHFQEER